MKKTMAIISRVHKSHDDLPAIYQAYFYEEITADDIYSKKLFTVKADSIEMLLDVARKYHATVSFHFWDGDEIQLAAY